MAKGKALIRFDAEWLVEMCKTRTEPFQPVVTCDGLPDDAQVLRCRVDVDMRGHSLVEVFVESEQLPEVPAGRPAPVMNPIFTIAEPQAGDGESEK